MSAPRPPRTPWPEAIDLQRVPHAEIPALVEPGTPVFIPVNPIEYHGPHLSLHNDRALCRGLIGLMHAALVPEQALLVCSDPGVGVEPVPGPGTQQVSLAQVRRRLRVAVQAVAELGAQRVVLATFHGAPRHSSLLHDAARWLSSRGIPTYAPMARLLHTLARLDGFAWPELTAHIPPPDRRRVQSGLAKDFHAGFVETSLALALAPQTVGEHRAVADCREVRPVPALLRLAWLAERAGRQQLGRELRMAAAGLGWQRLDPFPGYSSAPRFARAEVGWMLIRRVLPELIEEARAVLAGEAPSPAPPLSWLRFLPA